MLIKKLISASLIITALSCGTIFADDCHIELPGHGEGKTHKIEMTSSEWKDLSSSLKSKGMRIVYKGRNGEGLYVYYVYANDGDRKVDEKICLKCLGTQPPVTDPEIPLPDVEEGNPTPPIPELPDIELPPEIEVPLPETELG